MKINEVNVDKLVPYANNPRLNEHTVNDLVKSIREFGFNQPIAVDKDYVIITGHARYKASLVMGLEKVPVVVLDNLTDEQVKGYRLADNKVGEKSAWHVNKLEQELMDLSVDMAQFGFEDLKGQLDGLDFDMDESDSGEDMDVLEGVEDEPRGYSITYELSFKDEAEQEKWYDFIGRLRKEYPDEETITARVMKVVEGYMNG